MKGPEAERKLAKLGWSHVRRTGQGHDIWESPSGERQLFAFHEPINRNTVAALRQAERAARLKEDLMTTTSMDQIERVSPVPVTETPPSMRVYRSPDQGAVPAFAELRFGRSEAEHLGWPHGTARVYEDGNGLWRVERGGSFSVRKDGLSVWAVRAQALAAVIPHTAQTDIPVERYDGGFILHPERVVVVAPQEAQVPVAIKSTEPRTGPAVATHAEAKAYMKRLQEARQAAAAPAQPATATIEPPPAGDALAARETVSLPKRGASLDDLRAALDLLRTAVSDLGVTLHAADGSVLDLRDVSFRGKV